MKPTQFRHNPKPKGKDNLLLKNDPNPITFKQQF